MKRKFFYDIPTMVPDENGDVVLLNKKSISPLEFFQYGINKYGKYYLKWDYPMLGDDELESDYREISKERLKNDLRNEFKICIEEENVEIAEKIEEALNYIEKNDYTEK